MSLNTVWFNSLFHPLWTRREKLWLSGGKETRNWGQETTRKSYPQHALFIHTFSTSLITAPLHAATTKNYSSSTDCTGPTVFAIYLLVIH